MEQPFGEDKKLYNPIIPTTGFQSRVHAHKNGVNQNALSGNWTLVSFPTEIFDTLGEWDAVNSRFDPVAEGYYLVHVNMRIANVNAGQTPDITIWVNAGVLAVSACVIGGAVFGARHVMITALAHLVVGDVLRIYLRLDGGLPNPIISGTREYTYLNIHRLS